MYKQSNIYSIMGHSSSVQTSGLKRFYDQLKQEGIEMKERNMAKIKSFYGLFQSAEWLECATKPDFIKFGDWEEYYLTSVRAEEYYHECHESIEQYPDMWSDAEKDKIEALHETCLKQSVQESEIKRLFGGGVMLERMRPNFDDYLEAVKQAEINYGLFSRTNEFYSEVLGIVLHYLVSHLKTGQDFVVKMWLQNILGNVLIWTQDPVNRQITLVKD